MLVIWPSSTLKLPFVFGFNKWCYASNNFFLLSFENSWFVVVWVLIFDMVKQELRVASYKLRVESLKARVGSLKARVKIQKYEMKSTSYEFKSTSCEFKSTSYEFKSTSYEFKFTSFEFKSTSYEFKFTSLRIIKSTKTQANSLQIFTTN